MRSSPKEARRDASWLHDIKMEMNVARTSEEHSTFGCGAKMLHVTSCPAIRFDGRRRFESKEYALHTHSHYLHKETHSVAI